VEAAGAGQGVAQACIAFFVAARSFNFSRVLS
jgi:hypothetical protein